MKKQKTNKVKTVVYLIHFILIDIWARNGVLHIFFGELNCPSVSEVLEEGIRDKRGMETIFSCAYQEVSIAAKCCIVAKF